MFFKFFRDPFRKCLRAIYNSRVFHGLFHGLFQAYRGIQIFSIMLDNYDNLIIFRRLLNLKKIFLFYNNLHHAEFCKLPTSKNCLVRKNMISAFKSSTDLQYIDQINYIKFILTSYSHMIWPMELVKFPHTSRISGLKKF